MNDIDEEFAQYISNAIIFLHNALEARNTRQSMDFFIRYIRDSIRQFEIEYHILLTLTKPILERAGELIDFDDHNNLWYTQDNNNTYVTVNMLWDAWLEDGGTGSSPESKFIEFVGGLETVDFVNKLRKQRTKSLIKNL